MAFLSKAGNILRQAASKRANSNICASNPSVFRMIRCMSTSKVFVGGLSYATDDMSLTDAFSKYGEVVEARVIIDRETGRSRGFGFVTFTSGEEASAAIQALDGQDLQGRTVKVNYANERPPRGGGFGGGGGGYGGFGGGYGGGSGGYGGGGGNFGGSGGYGGADNYGGGSNYGNYGGRGGGGYGGNYGGGGGGNSFEGGNFAQGGTATYGGGSVAGGNYGTGGTDDTYGGGSSGTGSSVNYGGGSQIFNAAGGAGSDSYVSGDAGAMNSFGSNGSIGLGGSGEQFGSSESSGMAGTYGGFSQDDPIVGNFKDEDGDDGHGDYANRNA